MPTAQNAPLQITIAEASTASRKFQWGEVVDGFKIYACHDAQLDILASTAKYTAAFAGTGGGKTCLIGLWLFKKLNAYKLKNPEGKWRAMVVSPNTGTYKKSQLEQHIKEAFAGTVWDGTYKQQEKIYYLPDGSEIVVVTAENDYKRLSGGQYHAVVLDECWQMTNKEIWDEAIRRTNVNDAPILLVTTPNVDGWIYEEVFQRWEAGDKNYYVRQWATSANPVKSAEDHEKFLQDEVKKLGKAKYDRMYGGQFAQLTGLVYASFGDASDRDEYPIIPTLQTLARPAVRVFGSIDYGWRDPLAVYIYVHCDDDIVYIVDEFYGSEIPIDEAGAKIRALQEKWSTQYDSKYADVVKGGFFDCFYTDTSRPEVGAFMTKFGLPLRDKKVSMIEAGVGTVDQLFRAHRVKVFDCCTNLIREAKAYAWKDNRPRGGNDHAMDSIRYGLSSYFDGRPITPVVVSKIATDDHQVEVAKRLGHAEGKEDLERRIAKEQLEKYTAWVQHLMTCDDPD